MNVPDILKFILVSGEILACTVIIIGFVSICADMLTSDPLARLERIDQERKLIKSSMRFAIPWAAFWLLMAIAHWTGMTSIVEVRMDRFDIHEEVRFFNRFSFHESHTGWSHFVFAFITAITAAALILISWVIYKPTKSIQ
jgi:hypothetical protein